MSSWWAVALGGALGSLARHGLGLWLRAVAQGWPWATLLVNGLGGLLMGLLVSLASTRALPELWRLALTTGVLGGFTTFSAFSIETLELARRGLTPAVLNIGLNLLLALGGCALGLRLGRWLAPG